MMGTLERLEVSLRRAMADGSYDEAERIAVEIDRILGDPVENDRVPEAIPTWGVDA